MGRPISFHLLSEQGTGYSQPDDGYIEVLPPSGKGRMRRHHKDKKPGPVLSLIIRLVMNASALCIAAWLIPGIHLEGWKAIVIAALIFGVINTFIKPLVSAITCLIQVVTLGLFTFVINAGMLYLTAWITKSLDLTFTIDNFWSALVGAIIVSVVSFILTRLLR